MSGVSSFALGLGNLELGNHAGEQFLHDDGFHNVIVRAQVESLDNILVGVEGAQDDNLDIGGFGITLQAPDYFKTVYPGHHEVQENEVRFFLGNGVQGLLSVGSGANLEIVTGQHLLDQKKVQGDVVNSK